MVLHLVTALVLQTGNGPVNDQVLKDRAVSIVKICAGVSRGLPLSEFYTSNPTVERKHGLLSVVCGDALVSLHENGTLRSVAISHEPENGPDITDTEARELAQQYYYQLGGSAGDHEIVVLPDSSNYVHYRLPKAGGIPFVYDYGWRLELERKKGRLRRVITGHIPPVASTNVAVTKETALASAFEATARLRNFTEMASSSANLYMSVPRYGTLPNEQTQEQKLIGEQGKAVPVYYVHVADANTWSEEKKRYLDFHVVYVDARSGNAMAIQDLGSLFLGSGAKSKRTPSKMPNLGSKVGMFGDGKLTWYSAPKILRNKTVGEAGALSRVILHSKDSAIVADFSTSMGLLRLQSEDKTVWLKPDRAFLKTLIKVASKPVSAFGIASNL